MNYCTINIKDKEMRFVCKHTSSLLKNNILMNMLDRDDFTSEQREFIEKVADEYIKQFE